MAIPVPAPRAPRAGSDDASIALSAEGFASRFVTSFAIRLAVLVLAFGLLYAGIWALGGHRSASAAVGFALLVLQPVGVVWLTVWRLRRLASPFKLDFA